VEERTHRHGYILDLVILLRGVSVSSMLSYQFLINIDISLQTESVSVKFISYRKYKSIDMDAFLADLFSGIVLYIHVIWGFIILHIICIAPLNGSW